MDRSLYTLRQQTVRADGQATTRSYGFTRRGAYALTPGAAANCLEAFLSVSFRDSSAPAHKLTSRKSFLEPSRKRFYTALLVAFVTIALGNAGWGTIPLQAAPSIQKDDRYSQATDRDSQSTAGRRNSAHEYCSEVFGADVCSGKNPRAAQRCRHSPAISDTPECREYLRRLYER